VARDHRSGSLPLTVIRPPARWTALEVGQLVAFRELGYRLMRRDVTLRYRQTLLGVSWVVLQPLLAAGAFTLIFGRIADLPAPEGIPYFLLAFWGATAFNAFNSCLTKSSSSLVANSSLVNKVFFPRLLLPLSTVGASVLDVTVATVLGLLLGVQQGVLPGLALLTLPVWIGAMLLLGLAGGVLFAPLMLRYRDVAYVLPLMSSSCCTSARSATRSPPCRTTCGRSTCSTRWHRFWRARDGRPWAAHRRRPVRCSTHSPSRWPPWSPRRCSSGSRRGSSPMSSDTAAVRAVGLGKQYRIGQAPPESTVAESLLRRVRQGLGRPRTEAYTALDDVSFEVPPGQVLGVIGRNGAGKSTLLKVLTRVTPPTTGRAELRGRVGSLLEVGTGFHPELTGRENIFLNGAVLGMRAREVSARFDDIVEFAGWSSSSTPR
jgi:ABC-type polysaccharide/polyol phosphate export permease